MIRGTNPKTGRVEVLTNKRIKEEILDLSGWSAEEYTKHYAIYRNKLRNYEAITGATSKQKVNEVLLSSLRRLANDQPLTAFQAAVASTTSASTGTVKKQVAENRVSAAQIKNAFAGIEAEFAGLLEKGHYDQLKVGRTVYEAYQEWLNESVGEEIARDAKGNIIYDEETGKPKKTAILRSSTLTPADVLKWFKQTAKDLHERQAREYSTNAAKYGKNRRSVGS